MSNFAKWYREGTIALTNGSASVAGAATHWNQGNGIMAGDILVLGDSFYEISSVVSESQLTLDRPYAGASASGAPYGIIRNFNATPAASLVLSQVELIRRTLSREKQYIDWQSLPASGNPAAPTTITFTQYNGSTINVKSLPQIQADIDAAIAGGTIGPAGPAGPQGAPGAGLNWRGNWPGTGAIALADAVTHTHPSGTRSAYVCKVPHAASSATEPGVGANWALHWDVITEGSRGERGLQGNVGPAGIAGPRGFRGATWHTVTVSPSSLLGDEGDFALNSLTGAFWRKQASGWEARGTLQGPPGAQGVSIEWLPNGWNGYSDFTVGQALNRNGSAYICFVNHARSGATEPGVGESWASYWSVMVDGDQATSATSLPPGGAMHSFLVKASPADGDAEWRGLAPAGSVRLFEQSWAGTSLASLAARPYSALQDRPIDDNWRFLPASPAVNALNVFIPGYSPPQASPNFWISVHVDDTAPASESKGYRKMNFANLFQAIEHSVTNNTPAPFAMARQDSRNVDLKGGFLGGGVASFPGGNGVGYSEVATATRSGNNITINSSKAVTYFEAASPGNFTLSVSVPTVDPEKKVYRGRVYIKNPGGPASMSNYELASAEWVFGGANSTGGEYQMMDWQYLHINGAWRLFVTWITG